MHILAVRKQFTKEYPAGMLHTYKHTLTGSRG
jgi:hypothetical protein